MPELADSDELAREVLARASDEWQRHLTQGLRRMQARGDPSRLRVALDAALAYLCQHRQQ